MCDLDLCETMPDMAWQINVEGTRKMLAAVKKVPTVKKFIFHSTDHVFDGEKGPYTEEDPPAPKHVYGATKHRGEECVISSGLPYLIVRPGLVIGESFQGNKGTRDFLFSRIRAGKPTHLFTDEWRTPIEVASLVSRVLKLTLSESAGIFHVAGPEHLSRYEIGKSIAKKSGLPTKYILPRLRQEDEWAHIRPRNLSLISQKK